MEKKYYSILEKLKQDPSSLNDEELNVTSTEEFKHFKSEIESVSEIIRKNHLSDKKEFLKSLEPEPNKFGVWKLVGVLVILSLLVGTYFFMKKDSFYDNYYESYPMVELKRSSDSENENLIKGYQLYAQNDFHGAHEILKEFNNPSAKFYDAITQMELSEFESALIRLESLDENGSDSFPIYFYKGLCLIQLNRNEEAKLAFENLSDDFKYFKKQADEMLDKF